MSAVHYRFSSMPAYYKLVTFHGTSISVAELKMKILEKHKLSSIVKIFNELTDEEYKDEDQISKNSSVIVRKFPGEDVKPPARRSVINRNKPASGSSTTVSILDDSTATEEEKIRAALRQSAAVYQTNNWMRSPPPPNYVCRRCLVPGHYIEDCPRTEAQSIRKTTGIPRTFLKNIDDPSTSGAMMTKNGSYAIPIINAEAYALKKKERPPFLPPEEPPPKVEHRIPEDLVCRLCTEIMTDAAVAPCCGISFCDDCIRTSLLESRGFECPVCHQTGVSPDDIVPNKQLRKAIEESDNQVMWSQEQPHPAPSTVPQDVFPGPAHRPKPASQSHHHAGENRRREKRKRSADDEEHDEAPEAKTTRASTSQHSHL